jgi:hypothetical protein
MRDLERCAFCGELTFSGIYVRADIQPNRKDNPVMQVKHPVVEWYLGFDDLWELMRVNYGTHNPFTQSGMWDIEHSHVEGVVMVVDAPPYRGVLLRVDEEANDDLVVDFLVIVTYGPRCNECDYQPYDACWWGEEWDGDLPLGWAAETMSALFTNATMNGIEKRHEDECSRLRYPDPEPEVDDDG